MQGLFSKKHKKKKEKKKQIGRRNCKTSQALTSFYKTVKKYKENPIIERYVKDNTYLFSHQSLIIKMKSSSMWGKNKRLVLLLCSALHVISIFVVIERMKRVWQPRSEIRAKTVKTRVLGSSLSSSRPSAVILVIDMLIFFLTG